VTAFDGWPVLLNDEQPALECSEQGTNIWFAMLGWGYLHGILSDCAGEDMFIQRETIRPDDSKEVAHVILPAGLALGSAGALAGIVNATEPVAPGGGGAPVDATYVVVSADPTLTNERIAAEGFATSLTDKGAGQALVIGSWDVFKKFVFVEHFVNYDNSNEETVANAWLKTYSGLGIADTFVAAANGMVEFAQSSGSSGQRFFLHSNPSGTGNQGAIAASKNPKIVIRMRMTSAGTLNSPVIFAGAANEMPAAAVATPNPDSGIFIRKRSTDTNWIAVARSNTVESTLDTGIAANDSVFRDFELVVTGTSSVEVFVDGVSKGTISSNIPSETLGLFLGGSSGSDTGQIPTIEVDAIAVEQEV
jgi:hypothetical protein